MKYRNIYLIILTIGSICFLNGEDANIRSIRMDAEKLIFSDYTFDQFLEETGSRAKFFCGYKEDYYDLDYKTFINRVETKNPKIALFETDKGRKIRVDKNNFEKFRKIFYGYRPLEFEKNRFPARFFKVKTEDNLGKGNDNKIKFYEIPGNLNSEIDRKGPKHKIE